MQSTRRYTPRPFECHFHALGFTPPKVVKIMAQRHKKAGTRAIVLHTFGIQDSRFRAMLT